MNKTQRFREIAAKHNPDGFGGDNEWQWYETAPGVVTVDGHEIEIIESTNFNAMTTVNEYFADAGYATQNQWILVKFEDELYRLKGVYDSWDGGGWEDWQRVEEREVTKVEYVEVDND